MPNWIKNTIVIHDSSSPKSKHYNEIVSAITSYNPDLDLIVDFNRIIPMPDDIYQGIIGNAEREVYGERNWLDWSIKNWGTKWNAQSTEISHGIVTFETAWSHPMPVIKKLSTMFPNNRFEVFYADEDIGYNLGFYNIQNGRRRECYIENDLDFALDVWGIDRADYLRETTEEE